MGILTFSLYAPFLSPHLWITSVICQPIRGDKGCNCGVFDGHTINGRPLAGCESRSIPSMSRRRNGVPMTSLMVRQIESVIGNARPFRCLSRLLRGSVTDGLRGSTLCCLFILNIAYLVIHCCRTPGCQASVPV